jgi:hypothetical protein
MNSNLKILFGEICFWSRNCVATDILPITTFFETAQNQSTESEELKSKTFEGSVELNGTLLRENGDHFEGDMILTKAQMVGARSGIIGSQYRWPTYGSRRIVYYLLAGTWGTFHLTIFKFHF